MYILEGVLFPFEIFIENFNEQDKIYQVITQIKWGKLDEFHACYSGPGRKGYDRQALFRALVLKKLMGLTTTKALVKCLAYSPMLAHWCGFDIMKPTPSESVFSRFEKELTGPNFQKDLGDLCNSLSSQVLSMTISTGEIAIDSTDITAKERPRKDGETGAAFGHRTASSGETDIFYGYKLHLAAVNTNHGPIPVAARIAPANYSDFEFAETLMNEGYYFHNKAFGFAPSYYLMDAGYDAEYIYSQALKLRGQAIVKLNHRGKKGTYKEHTDYGTPLCPGKNAMVYRSTEKKILTNKFRCPRIFGQPVDCQCECGCTSSYGYVKRVSINENPRMFCSPTVEAVPGISFIGIALQLKDYFPC
ncbi:transposase [Desulfoscipio sp. XC116]|uniref:transposase n=1 Tax=Desulfoscipio sp. XC116 TaxID=3144975 RepID=UPI00325AB79D